jgi:DASH complex subunit SPC19
LGGNGGGADSEKAAKLRQLQQKKERLAFAVERLQLQSAQRQRQLRKTVSYAGQDFKDL